MTTQNSFREIVRNEVLKLLDKSPAYQRLDRETQRDLTQSMSDIASYLTDLNGQGQYPGVFAQGPVPWRQTGNKSPSQPQKGTGKLGASAKKQQGAVNRVGEVARATLNAIDFPSFVGSLIEGVFQSIVDASIRQMEAYAELVKNIASTTSQFMQDNVTDDSARDYLVNKFPDMLSRDTTAGTPRLTVNTDAYREGEMPSFFRDLGFDSLSEVDEETVEQVVVPAARKTMAEQRQQVLATMVLMGINRVLVDDGEIKAKLVFHIDASESTNITFDQTKTTTGNISRTAGKSPFTANALMVNTTSLNAQSDINVRADLTGEVRVKFRSETFPLERFADSAAIQLINSHAKVPEPQAVPARTPAGNPASLPQPKPADNQGTSDPWAPK